MRTLEFKIPADFENKPLLYFLKGHLKFSEGIVGTLRHTEGAVKVNGKNARVIDKIHEGDELKITLPEKSTAPLLWDAPLDIVYEDEDILIINKPAGVSCHPSHNHPNFTLANAVSFYLLKTEGEAKAARTVGRLDKGTSGLLLFAKHSYAASRLNGKIEKTYFALAGAHLENGGTVDTPIFRPDPLKTLRDTGEGGDFAVTHFTPIGFYGDFTLLKVTIETGRTHQIRVHLKSIGAPLVGDDMYGGVITKYLSRTALHCGEISFIHPATGESLHFSLPLPKDITSEINSHIKNQSTQA